MKLAQVIAFPLSLDYGLVVLFRNKLYDWGLLKSTSFLTPTLCVGNLSLGGTGKTPMIELLIRALSAEYKIAVLSRGYGRKTKGLFYATSVSTSSEIGDEPKQIKEAFPEIEVVVSESRVKGMEYIERELNVDLVLLDDAFQHRKITPKVNLLLTTFDRLYTNDFYLPAGRLRDHKSSAQRADIVIVTKAPSDLIEYQKQTIRCELKLKADQQLFFSSLAYQQQLKGVENEMELDDLKENPFCLVTGIANANPLVAYLKNRGLMFTHQEYRDHKHYSDSDIESLRKESLILTTEKDYVKLKGRLSNVYRIAVSHQIDRQDIFLSEIIKLIKA